MIDGLPAFPDEVPESAWNELRIGLTAGMVTIRRGRGSMTCVIWGNSDSALQLAWFKVILACARVGKGIIETPAGPMTADEFAKKKGL